MNKSLFLILFSALLTISTSSVFAQPETEEKKPAAEEKTQPAEEKPAAEEKPETKPEKKPEPKPEPKPETKPEKKPEPKPEPKPETKPEKKPEPKPEPTPETKPEKKPEPKPEPKPETKPEKKPEPKPEPKPETKPEKKPEPKPEPKPETKPEKKPEPKPETKEPALQEPENVITNLESPSGIAVHDGGDVFVSSRYGIYRYNPTEHSMAIEIAGYKNTFDTYGKGPKYDIGPLGLAFLNKDHLVVGDGSRVDGEELVRVFKVGDKAPEKWVKETDSTYTLGPITKGEKSARGEGNFYGVAIADNAIFVTCNGDDTKGWISKAAIDKDGKPGKLEPTIATKEATEVDAPVAITVSPDGKLVVGQMGEMTVPGDSLLTIYDPKTGKLEKKYETGLSDIAGLAYSPKTKKLYAVDFSWADPTKGGLFRLDIADDKVTATKLYSLDKPASLAFGKDGKLYVTVFNSATEEDKKAKRSSGALVVFKDEL